MDCQITLHLEQQNVLRTILGQQEPHVPSELQVESRTARISPQHEKKQRHMVS